MVESEISRAAETSVPENSLHPLIEAIRRDEFFINNNFKVIMDGMDNGLGSVGSGMEIIHRHFHIPVS